MKMMKKLERNRQQSRRAFRGFDSMIKKNRRLFRPKGKRKSFPP